MRDQLRFTTNRLTSTLTDLNQRQVLDNLTRVADQPSFLPYFAVITDGISDVKDGGSIAADFEAVVGEFTKGTYSPGATRDIEGNWSLKPTVNPKRILAMRGAYRRALGLPIHQDEAELLEYYIGDDWQAKLPANFVCVGRRFDVPHHDVSYVDHYHSTYIWVPCENAEAFSRFTLAIMELYVNRLGEGNIPGKGEVNNGFRSETRSIRSVPSADFPSNGFNPGLFLVPRG